MAIGLLATKVGMTQIFTEDGVRMPVTVLSVQDNKVVQKRTLERDGYTAIQVGYGDKSQKRVTKSMAGHYQKAGVTPKRTLREFRCTPEEIEKYEVGGDLSLDILDGVGSLNVTGTSKGKGFAGVMKRHNFKGFRATHGTHEYFRHGGSIGCRAKPGRVFKGKKMPGQMGNETVTVSNISIEQILPEENLVLVRGAVPGGKGQILELQPSSHSAHVGRGMTQEQQAKSKNPMKASKAGG